MMLGRPGGASPDALLADDPATKGAASSSAASAERAKRRGAIELSSSTHGVPGRRAPRHPRPMRHVLPYRVGLNELSTGAAAGNVNELSTSWLAHRKCPGRSGGVQACQPAE